MTFASRVLAGMGAAFRRRAGDLLEPTVEALSSGVDAADTITGTDTDPFPTLFDLDATDYPAWLGQATGTPAPGGLSLSAQRAYVKDRPNARRGTPAAIAAAVQATLVGDKRVTLIERDGDADHIRVQVRPSETPDPTATLAAAMSQKPVGLLLTLEVATGGTWAHIVSDHGPTWADLMAEFQTWADVRDHEPEAL